MINLNLPSMLFRPSDPSGDRWQMRPQHYTYSLNNQHTTAGFSSLLWTKQPNGCCSISRYYHWMEICIYTYFSYLCHCFSYLFHIPVITRSYTHFSSLLWALLARRLLYIYAACTLGWMNDILAFSSSASSILVNSVRAMGFGAMWM